MKTTLKVIKTTKGLPFTILGIAAFWFIIFLILLSVIAHWIQGHNHSEYMNPSVFIAITIGSSIIGVWLAKYFSRGRVELGMVPFGGFGMSLCLGCLAFLSWSTPSFISFISFIAIFSGFFKLPLNYWIRERVHSQHIEHVISVKNLVVLFFILLSVGVFTFLLNSFDERFIFKFSFFSILFLTILILFRIPAMFVRFIFFFTANLLYKVKIDNKENIPLKTGGLIIANHVSLLDSFLIVASVPRNVRFVMLKEVYDHPLCNWWFKRLNMIPVPGKRTKEDLDEFNKRCREVINEGHVICIFPEGQLSRTGHLMGFKKGIEHITANIDAPIIPMHIQGLVGAMLTYEVGSGKLVLPKLKSRRPTVRIKIGEPRFDKPSAFELRLQIMELQAYNYEAKTQAYITRKYLIGSESLKKLTQAFALKEILAVREGVKVLTTYPKESYLDQLATAFQTSNNSALFAHTDKVDLKEKILIWEPAVLLTDSSTLEELYNEEVDFSTIDKILLSDLHLDDMIKKELEEVRGIIVLEAFVYDDLVIAINTPDLVTRDVTGKQVVQMGTKEDTAGRPVPGIALKILNDANQLCGINEEGTLVLKKIGFSEWVDTKIPAKLDEDGFLIVKHLNR